MSNESLTIVWEGKTHVVKKGAPNFLGLRTAIIEENWDDVPKYLTVAKSIESWSNDKFVIKMNTVLYMGEELPQDLNQRIISMSSAGENPTIIFNFWERLQKNPSWRSVNQLWSFLSHSNIPFTEDGCFLAYKGVQHNYKDAHSGKFDNSPGRINEMPRNKISDDPSVACHFGFHVGDLSYAQGFSQRVVVCKVDPEHVVCVPNDCGQRKMRVCKYEVVGNYGTALPSVTFKEDKYEEYENQLDKDIDGEELDENEMEKAPPPEDVEDDGSEDVEIEIDDEEEDKESEDGEDDPLDIKYVIADAKKNEDKPKPKDKITSTKSKVKKPKFKDKRKLDKLGMPKLMEESLDTLRKYATYGLEITGASKIPGGKTALVAQIIKVRK